MSFVHNHDSMSVVVVIIHPLRHCCHECAVVELIIVSIFVLIILFVIAIHVALRCCYC